MAMIIAVSMISFSEAQSLDAYLNDLHQNGQLNGNILVFKKDTVLYERSFGYVDGSKDELLNQDYHFMLGSIYKEFPAVAIMQLKEKGLLTLEDHLSELLPDMPEWAMEIQLKHLLQYSSGLPKVNWGALFQSGERVNIENVLQQLNKLDSLAFTPGEDYIYSNYNPMLLMKVVERFTNKDFTTYVEQDILKAFNIEGVLIKGGYPYKDKEGMAIPFDSQYKEDDTEFDLPHFCATTRGMQKWLSKLDDFEIINQASVQQISEKAFEGDGFQSPLGHCIWVDGMIVSHIHHGSSGNYECLIKNYKKDDLMIVLLTNQKNRNLHDIADRIYAVYEE